MATSSFSGKELAVYILISFVGSLRLTNMMVIKSAITFLSGVLFLVFGRDVYGQLFGYERQMQRITDSEVSWFLDSVTRFQFSALFFIMSSFFLAAAVYGSPELQMWIIVTIFLADVAGLFADVSTLKRRQRNNESLNASYTVMSLRSCFLVAYLVIFACE